MIYETHQPDLETLSLPAVAAWVRFPACPKCGHALGAGHWLLALWAAARGESAQNYAYCQGNQNSSMQVPGIAIGEHGPSMALQSIPVACFGVYEEHLHCRCGRCGFQWLMGVKGK